MVSRKCIVAVDAQAQSMCSLQSAYAPREALDPGVGEAMLGQALHDHGLPRDYPRGETAAIFAHEQSC